MPGLILALSVLACLLVLVAWSGESEHRPQHAANGKAALTVWQLRAQVEQSTRELIVWPVRDPDVEDPGSRYLPGTVDEPTGWAAPTPAHLRRVLAGLQRL